MQYSDDVAAAFEPRSDVRLADDSSFEIKTFIGTRSTRVCCFCSLFATLSLLVLASFVFAPSASADAGFPGVTSGCDINKADFDADIALVFAAVPGLDAIVTTIGAFELPNGLGVAWVDPSNPMQSETGVVEEKSDYSTSDLPWDHNSHDQSFDVAPDLSSQFLRSDANIED